MIIRVVACRAAAGTRGWSGTERDAQPLSTMHPRIISLVARTLSRMFASSSRSVSTCALHGGASGAANFMVFRSTAAN